MANGRRGRPVSSDPWAAYDSLPGPVRAAMQEGPQAWSAIWVRTQWRKQAKAFGEAHATRLMVLWINAAHAEEIAEARAWQPKRQPFQKAPPKVPSPHLLAQATMQTSGR